MYKAWERGDKLSSVCVCDANQISSHTDLKARLEAIDAKFTLQASELEHMRERLQHAESGHHKSLMRGRLLEEQQRELMEEQKKRRMDSTPYTQVCHCTHVGCGACPMTPS